MIDLKERAGTAMNVQSQLNEQAVDGESTIAAFAFAGDLGKLLWRMKYGQDVKLSGFQRATLLLANRMRQSHKFSRAKFTGLDRNQSRDKRRGRAVEVAESDIVERFARRVIFEWCCDQCLHCSGRGQIGRTAIDKPAVRRIKCPTCHGSKRIVIDEQPIPLGHNGRGPMFVRDYERCPTCIGIGSILEVDRVNRLGRAICGHCGGTGRAPIDEAARALALGLRLDHYRANWPRMFDAALALLDTLDGQVGDTMRRQLQR
ncbi:hypothetical protein [Burkholderia gladioli]|uniref:hypothetical protein n=1 Tax=Burkholderia gladioli TaxID=28095 RepID=UPI00163FA82D|nr:hypothetical protein [Burkholderia gladioli]MBW5284456.1 hypothetical protein [Burkholderia gladioli]